MHGLTNLKNSRLCFAPHPPELVTALNSTVQPLYTPLQQPSICISEAYIKLYKMRKHSRLRSAPLLPPTTVKNNFFHMSVKNTSRRTGIPPNKHTLTMKLFSN